jgi:hypothetical protein
LVDESLRLGWKFVDKAIACLRPRPVWFVLPEGAIATDRRGEG